MNYLDEEAKRIFTQGNKVGAINLLLSSLSINDKDIDAWLLLGEITDDSKKKKECYNKVLQLSPDNPLALNGLRNLSLSNNVSVENPAYTFPDIQSRETNASLNNRPVQDFRMNVKNEKSSDPSDGLKTIGYITLGIGGFIGISYILGLILSSGDPYGDSNPLCMGVMCLGLIAGAFILNSFWSSSSKERREAAKAAIEEQKMAQPSSSSTNSSYNNANVCRVCQHIVSRTAPSCPNCGELYPGLVSKCPYCGSKDIHITPKGYSLGKAAAGAVIAGPVGAVGGLHGRKDLDVICSSCGRTITIRHDEI